MRCAESFEKDDEPCDERFAYTNFIDLSKIIGAQWRLFQSDLPERHQRNKREFERDFRRLNKIRNAVMHPVKRVEWALKDLVFVREMSDLFDLAGAVTT